MFDPNVHVVLSLFYSIFIYISLKCLPGNKKKWLAGSSANSDLTTHLVLYLLLCHVTVWQTCLSWHQRHCGASMLHTSNLCAFQTAKVLNGMKYLFMKNSLPVNSSVSCWFIASSLQYIEETPYSPFLSESEWFGASLSTARLSDRKPNPWLTGLLPATDRYLVTCCHISVNRYSSHFENAIHIKILA